MAFMKVRGFARMRKGRSVEDYLKVPDSELEIEKEHNKSQNVAKLLSSQALSTYFSQQKDQGNEKWKKKLKLKEDTKVNYRKDRVGVAAHTFLSEQLVNVPHADFVLCRVEMSNDLRNAYAYWTLHKYDGVVGKKENVVSQVGKELKTRESYLRYKMTSVLKLRVSANLIFKYTEQQHDAHL